MFRRAVRRAVGPDPPRAALEFSAPAAIVRAPVKTMKVPM